MRLPPQLRSITTRALCAALERDGFVLDRQRGSHRVYYNPTNKRQINSSSSDFVSSVSFEVL